MWQRVPRLLGLLRDRLMAQHGLSLGLALRQDSVGPASPLRPSNLSVAAVYLLPPSLTARRYNFTFSFFSEETLEKIRKVYQQASSSGAGTGVCYLFPAATYTFKVARHESPLLNPQVPSLGPGIQGLVTKLPGKMAHFETCHLVKGYEKLERNYDVLAALNGSWLSYTSHTLLRHFLDELQKNLSDTCWGIWNPQWDDFANFCANQRAYPLSRALVRLYNY
ncbi:uncharacterized protein LOC144168334 [Haemaphysalis longicornis]